MTHTPMLAALKKKKSPTKGVDGGRGARKNDRKKNKKQQQLEKQCSEKNDGCHNMEKTGLSSKPGHMKMLLQLVLPTSPNILKVSGVEQRGAVDNHDQKLFQDLTRSLDSRSTVLANLHKFKVRLLSLRKICTTKCTNKCFRS